MTDLVQSLHAVRLFLNRLIFFRLEKILHVQIPLVQTDLVQTALVQTALVQTSFVLCAYAHMHVQYAFYELFWLGLFLISINPY